MSVIPRPGEVLIVDRQASVQFADLRQLVFRVISVSRRPTYEGWAWIHGYVLDSSGAATERREIFVRCDGPRLFEPRAGCRSMRDIK